MQHTSPPTARLGILGGGQLGRMLAEAGMRQGLAVTVLAPEPEVPAAHVGIDLLRGRLDDPIALDRLCAQCDVITIENEFLDVATIRKVLHRHPQLSFQPSLDAIAIAQDKLAQKRRFELLGLPTASYQVIQAAHLAQQRSQLHERFPGGFVLKWSRFGYDGLGNLVVASPEMPLAMLESFCRRGELAGGQVYAERMIPFSAECAMVATRFSNGRMHFFPLVLSRQENGVCREVVAPASAIDLPAHLEEQARSVIQRLADSLEFCGTLAVEFFLTEQQDLLLNELAPRVHNTGHYTLFGSQTSQFDLHVRAVCRQPPLAAVLDRPAVMRNLLGPRDLDGEIACSRPDLPPPTGVELYWYDKTTVKPGRKMGHLCAQVDNPAELPALRQQLRDYEDQLWQSLSISKEARPS